MPGRDAQILQHPTYMYGILKAEYIRQKKSKYKEMRRYFLAYKVSVRKEQCILDMYEFTVCSLQLIVIIGMFGRIDTHIGLMNLFYSLCMNQSIVMYFCTLPCCCTPTSNSDGIKNHHSPQNRSGLLFEYW